MVRQANHEIMDLESTLPNKYNQLHCFCPPGLQWVHQLCASLTDLLDKLDFHAYLEGFREINENEIRVSKAYFMRKPLPPSFAAQSPAFCPLLLVSFTL